MTKKKNLYLRTILLNAAVILAVSVLLRIYPFGSNGLCFADGDQYFGFYAMMQRALLSKEDLFYTWSAVLGGNALSEAAYYCLSPFNLLLILFPGNLLLGVHFVVFLKLILSSVTFCMLLNYVCDGYENEKPLFAVAYSHMGYALAYIWNSSWLDGIFILPLILLGIMQIVREKKPWLYIFSLAFIIISNFYIGFMICICSVIAYVGYLAYSSQSFWKAFRGSFLYYAGASLLGGALSAPALFTVLCDMPDGRQISIGSILQNMHANLRLENIFSMLFTGSMDARKYDVNFPIIFVGILFTVLAVLYFFNDGISVRKKIVSLSLVGVLVCSFHNSALNMVWHGFSTNNWFNYRYSFAASFLLLLLSFESYRNLKTLKAKDFWHGTVFLLLAVAITFNRGNPGVRSMVLMYVDVIAGAICMGGLWQLITKPEGKKRVLAGLCALMALNIVVNDFLSIRDGVDPRFGTEVLSAQRSFREDRKFLKEEGLYRMETLPMYGRCPAALLGYEGVTNYASTENIPNQEKLKALGVQHVWLWGRYTPDMPLSSEALLGIRYLMSQEAVPQREEFFRGMLPSGGYLYENPYALTRILPAYELDPAADVNPFRNLNRMFSTLTGEEEEIFKAQAYALTEQITEYKTQYTFTFQVTEEAPLYVSVPQPEIIPGEIHRIYYPMEVAVNGKPGPAFTVEYDQLCLLGTWEPGTEISVTMTPYPEFEKDQVFFAYEQRDRIPAVMEKIGRTEVQELKSSKLQFVWSQSEGETQHFASTIPYDEGWTVYDNGEKIPLQKNWDNFLAFTLEGAGDHVVTLKYVPAGFRAGLAVAGAALAIMALGFAYSRRSAKKKK